MSTPDRDQVAQLTALVGQLRGELDRLRARDAARAVIERATGMMMERLGCPPEEARQQLARLAVEAGVTQAEIAAEITGADLASAPADTGKMSRADTAIAEAADAAHLADALLTEALAAEGAVAAAVWILVPDGGIELAGEAGFGPLEASRWRRIPPGVPSLPLKVIRTEREIWWPSGQPAGDDSVLIGQPGSARAVVPLSWHGACFAALEACWPSPMREFPVAVRRMLPALAGPAAQALSAGLPSAGYAQAWVFSLLDGLHEAALFAHAVRDEEGTLSGLVVDWASDGFRDPAGRTSADVTGRRLLELYPEASGPSGLPAVAAQVLASGEPRHIAALPLPPGGVVDAAIAPLFDGVVIAWRDASQTERLEALLEQAEWLGQAGGWEENLVTGQMHWSASACALFGLQPGNPVRLADLHQRVPAEDVPVVHAFRRRVTGQPDAVTGAFRIIRASDQSVRQVRVFAQPVTGPAGEVIAVRGAYQDVSDRYHTQAAFAVTQAQLAGSEEQVREEHDLAVRLQQAITPRDSQPVEAAGIDVTARYRPASQQHLVGGDWYDTVLLPGKTVLLAVGDVAGHGIGAVTGMVALRNHLRGLAITGAGPAALLTWLNSAAIHLAGVMATAICGIYDPSARILHWARAGHLPPLVIRDGLAHVPATPDGMLLGADPGAVYAETSLQLHLGDAIVLFTDGLIENRGQSLDSALSNLRRLASRPVTDISQLASDLLDEAASDTGDDTCLVAVRIR